MLSAGALSGGITFAIARAFGGNRRTEADALVLHALVINGTLGILALEFFLVWSRQIHGAMFGQGRRIPLLECLMQ